MKKHIDNAKRAIAILDNILNTLDDLEIKHLKAQSELDAQEKMAA